MDKYTHQISLLSENDRKALEILAEKTTGSRLVGTAVRAELTADASHRYMKRTKYMMITKYMKRTKSPDDLETSVKNLPVVTGKVFWPE